MGRFRTNEKGKKYPITPRKGNAGYKPPNTNKKIKPNELKWIKHDLYEKYQKDTDEKGGYQIGNHFYKYDPSGMGRETADNIVAHSSSKESIKKIQGEIKQEKQQTYLSNTTKKYYYALDRELDSYLSKSEDTLDMYRIPVKKGKWKQTNDSV